MSARTDRATVAAAAAIAVLFSAGIVRLFLLRFEAGDIYPPYSSLRSDPLGSRVFYDSLAACRQLTVTRNYEPPDKVAVDADTALLYLGDTFSHEDRVPLEVAGALSSFVRKGGRLVFTFVPEAGQEWKHFVGDEGDD